MDNGTWIKLVTVAVLAYAIIKLQPLNDAKPTIDAVNQFMQQAGLLPAGS
ncbi:MAG TPA: hypothetical protein PL001_00085 [Candidatus Kryptobacter bacterium]|nr:hypothetical protein [Candidatus Kryptobacter bacterium]